VTKTKHELAPRVRLWIESPDRSGSFGDGKMRLLQAIDEEGSLRAAAKRLGISYRKAWGDLKKAESCFSEPLLIKSRGGKDGGRTALTLEGHALIDAYLAFRHKVDGAVQESFFEFLKVL
jgi:molybdate transport system regulatory protein